MATTAKLVVGSVFARDFRVIKPLAEGGMGAVYVVEQVSTRKRRALKIVRAELIGDAKAAERFVQEATVGAAIQSEHVVEVIAAGVDEPSRLPWMAMELLDGEDLDAVVGQRGRLPVSHALEVFKQLCHGLAAAHAAGVVHRDLKPENIFVARSRRADAPFTVKVLDFGIAKVMQESKHAATTTSVIGSPLWMAPEQIKAEKISAATDVWALGLIAFWLLTGRNYWRAANAESTTLEALLAEKLFGEIESPSARATQLGCAEAVPPGFDAWFLRCVAREPSARFRDAGEAFSALSPVLAAAAAGALPPRESYAVISPASPSSATPTMLGSSPQSRSNEAFAPTLAHSGDSLATSSRGSMAWLYALGAVTLLAAGAYAGVRFKSAMRARASGGPAVAAVEANPSPVANPPPVIAAPDKSDAGAFSTAVVVDAGEGQRVRSSPSRSRARDDSAAENTANANAHPPSPAAATPPSAVPPAPRPMPNVGSRLAALASLEAQAERTEQQAAHEADPNRAASLRDAAHSIRRSADQHLDQVEAQARAMMATEPANAQVLLDYVRQGRDFLRQRRAGHP